MNKKENVIFRRIRGRIVPISGKTAVVAAAAGGTYLIGSKIQKNLNQNISDVKPNKFLQSASFATSAASGILSGALFFARGKTFWAGIGATTAMDWMATAMGTAAWAGKDHLKERAVGAAKTESINQGIGWGTLATVAAFHPKTRQYVRVLGKNRMWKYLGRAKLNSIKKIFRG